MATLMTSRLSTITKESCNGTQPSGYLNGAHFLTAKAIGNPTRKRWPIGPVMIDALVQVGQRWIADTGMTTKFMTSQTNSPYSNPEMIGLSTMKVSLRLAR